MCGESEVHLRRQKVQFLVSFKDLKVFVNVFRLILEWRRLRIQRRDGTMLAFKFKEGEEMIGVIFILRNATNGE